MHHVYVNAEGLAFGIFFCELVVMETENSTVLVDAGFSAETDGLV